MSDKRKSKLHKRNKHQNRYDLEALVDGCPDLATHITTNPKGATTINFFDPLAVKMLNKALLIKDYNIQYWDIPDGYLCPPIPGRADYIHHIADLLAKTNNGIIPKGEAIRILDIGVGANCIYPIVGVSEYGWSFVGTEIDTVALESAQNIIDNNDTLTDKIELRHQPHSSRFIRGIIQGGEQFDVTICNPPFHASFAEASKATSRKLKNLKGKKNPKLIHNFGGQNTELWYQGGEIAFVTAMIQESRHYPYIVKWFTTLVSKQSNLRTIYKKLKEVRAKEVVTIEMGQGQKQSRIVAWRY